MSNNPITIRASFKVYLDGAFSIPIFHMTASRIKGITVEIGGDTTKLQTALKGVNSEIKNTQSQLKDVEKLLKYDALQREIIETEEYLKKL